MDFKFYRRLVEIRLLMDFELVKAKQLLTNLIKELEEAERDG